MSKTFTVLFLLLIYKSIRAIDELCVWLGTISKSINNNQLLPGIYRQKHEYLLNRVISDRHMAVKVIEV